jgi:hypothetical protein
MGWFFLANLQIYLSLIRNQNVGNALLPGLSQQNLHRFIVRLFLLEKVVNFHVKKYICPLCSAPECAESSYVHQSK